MSEMDLGKLLATSGDVDAFLGGLPESMRGELAKRGVHQVFGEILRDRLRKERAARNFREPAADDYGILTELLKRPAPEIPYLVDSLQGRNHNVGLTGQYKVGKTTTLCTYVKSLADDEPFLLRPTHLQQDQKVGWLNFEMDTDDLLAYLRPLNIQQPDRIALLNLRGLRLPLLSDPAFDWLKQWLVGQQVGALVIDSWRRLCGSCGISENRNEEVEELTERLDQLKKGAGVPSLLVTAHTPREKLPEGEERARGATAFDDWVDVRWVQTRSNGARFLAAQGRGVPERERALIFDETTRLVTVGGGDRGEHRREEGVEHVVNIVTAHHLTGDGNLTKNELKTGCATQTASLTTITISTATSAMRSPPVVCTGFPGQAVPSATAQELLHHQIPHQKLQKSHLVKPVKPSRTKLPMVLVDLVEPVD